MGTKNLTKISKKPSEDLRQDRGVEEKVCEIEHGEAIPNLVKRFQSFQ